MRFDHSVGSCKGHYSLDTSLRKRAMIPFLCIIVFEIRETDVLNPEYEIIHAAKRE